MPQSLYTPFMTEGTRNMGNAFMQYSQNKRQGQQQAMMQDLTKRAYMGDQQAMAELTGVNPQMAMQIRQSQRNVRQDKLSTDALQIKTEDRTRDQSLEKQDFLSGVLREAVKLPWPEAQAYAQRETDARADVFGQIPPLSEEAYNQVKQIQAEQPEVISDLDKAKEGKVVAETKILEENFKALASDKTSPEDKVKIEKDLRQEVFARSKDFDAVDDAWTRIKVSAKDPSAAGDLALIFNFMKMLDPGSTVREGEFATAAASAGLSDRMIAAAAKLDSGERLGKVQRKDFLDRADRLYKAAKSKHDKLEGKYKKLAKEYKVDPGRVILSAPAAPKFLGFE